jgi:tetratricopeptide (TPR) repeat protein
LERAAAASADIYTLTDLAAMQSQCNRVSDALSTVQRALADKRDGRLLRLRSEILADVAEWSASVEAAREAATLLPLEENVYRTLGWALEHVEGGARQAEALDVYREAVRLNGKSVLARRGVADMLWSLGKRDQAVTEYQALLETLTELADADPEQNHDVGWCLCRIGRHQEAAEAYVRALAVLTDRAVVLFDIGLNWLAAGEQVRAADAYVQGFEVVQARHNARHRGMLDVAAQDLREAIKGNQVVETEQTSDLLSRLKETARAYPIDPPRSA